MKDTERRDIARIQEDYGAPQEPQPCTRCGSLTTRVVCDRCAKKEDRNGELLALIGTAAIVVPVILGILASR